MNVGILGHEICQVKNIQNLLTIPGTTPISDTNPLVSWKHYDSFDLIHFGSQSCMFMTYDHY